MMGAYEPELADQSQLKLPDRIRGGPPSPTAAHAGPAGKRRPS